MLFQAVLVERMANRPNLADAPAIGDLDREGQAVVGQLDFVAGPGHAPDAVVLARPEGFEPRPSGPEVRFPSGEQGDGVSSQARRPRMNRLGRFGQDRLLTTLTMT